MTNEALTLPTDFPNHELIRRSGWNVSSHSGSYAVAWRGREEILLVWKNGTWERAAGRGEYRDAA